jgi:beta-lactam-binding protein with PASTA domain
MEWVITILAIGCVFFAFQIVMEYVKYKAVVNPRIKRLQAAKGELQIRILNNSRR